MPLLSINGSKLALVEQDNFALERDLQRLIEQNLEVVFNSRYVASEFPTGAQHAGRIDTLALSEDNNPVIIEYKKVESSELINQSLFYLSWIHDHRGDFEIAVHRRLGQGVEVDWSDVRVICIAPNYRKYDLHAVRVMGASIELWKYRLFKNSSLYLEEVFRRAYPAVCLEPESDDKNPVMVAAGKKAAVTRATGEYTFKQHLEGKPDGTRRLAELVQEFILEIDSSIQEDPKKFYVAYKLAQNIACMEVNRHQIVLYLKLDPASIGPLPDIARDVTKIGHYGTGNLELTIKSEADVESSKKFIHLAYERMGG